MAGFDFNALLENPQFIGGMQLLGGAREPNAMQNAFQTMQEMRKMEVYKREKEQERELEKARSALYERQVKTAEENSARQLKKEAWLEQATNAFYAANGMQPPGTPPQGVTNAPQQSQLPAGNPSSLPAQPQQTGLGAVEPPEAAKALMRVQGDIEALNRELARPNNTPEQRAILKQELEQTTQRAGLLSKLQPQQPDPFAQYRNSKLFAGAIRARTGDLGGLGDMAEASKPQTATPGQTIFGPGGTVTLPNPELQHRIANDAAQLAQGDQRIAIEGQRVGLEERRTQTTENEEARKKREADQKRAESAAADWKAFGTMNNNADLLEQKVEKLDKHPGLPKIFGFQGMLPDAPGFDAADARALHKSVVAQQARDTLTAMREASKTGGALGNVSDKDIQLLEDAVISLDKAQSVSAAKDALRTVKQQTEKVRDLQAGAFEKAYGKSPFADDAPVGSRPVPGKQRDGKQVFRDPKGREFIIN